MFLVSSCLWLVLTGHRQVLHIYSPLSRFAYLVLVLDVLRLLQYDNVVKSSEYTDHTSLHMGSFGVGMLKPNNWVALSVKGTKLLIF